jgi:hypothetical protein
MSHISEVIDQRFSHADLDASNVLPQATGGCTYSAGEVGPIGCCDASPNSHATIHFPRTRHFLMASFELGEDWFWNCRTRTMFDGPKLREPRSRPPGQSPGL